LLVLLIFFNIISRPIYDDSIGNFMYTVPDVPESPLHVIQLVWVLTIYGLEIDVTGLFVTVTGAPLDNDEITTIELVFVLLIELFEFNNQYPQLTEKIMMQGLDSLNEEETSILARYTG
jgi:hypothetical protein